MENANPSQGTGYVIVNVTSANGAIPLSDATVRIFEYSPDKTSKHGKLIATLKTDRTGKSDIISLSAPPRSSSLYPNKNKSYSTYNIEAYLEGYYPQQYINVPVFDGITAIQNINLVPIAENGRENVTYNTRFYENENQFLE